MLKNGNFGFLDGKLYKDRNGPREYMLYTEWEGLDSSRKFTESRGVRPNGGAWEDDHRGPAQAQDLPGTGTAQGPGQMTGESEGQAKVNGRLPSATGLIPGRGNATE